LKNSKNFKKAQVEIFFKKKMHCENCGNDRLVQIEGGFYVCEICGTQSQEFRAETVDFFDG